HGSGASPALSSFPTRRSSDLRTVQGGQQGADLVDLARDVDDQQRVGAGIRGDAAARRQEATADRGTAAGTTAGGELGAFGQQVRSEEHTSELQSRENLVCRLL